MAIIAMELQHFACATAALAVPPEVAAEAVLPARLRELAMLPVAPAVGKARAGVSGGCASATDSSRARASLILNVHELAVPARPAPRLGRLPARC